MALSDLIPRFDSQRVRRDFPILERTMHGRPLVYLDSAATSQKPQSVIDACAEYYQHSNANVHRGVYQLAEEATAAYEGARARVARFINSSVEETIFTRNASEAINLVARTWGTQHVRAGDVILLTPMEHHSNLVPWQMLAATQDAHIRYVDMLPDGSLDLDSLDRELASGSVRLLACAYVSNVLGTVNPIREMARRAHAAGAAILVDAAQAVPHRAVDVRDLDADFLAFTGHKMLGPMGIGVLFGKRALLESMPPFLGGGEMISRVDAYSFVPNDLPWKFEAGTPSVGDAVGLGRAVEYLQAIGMDAIEDHDRDVAAYLLSRLRDVDDVTIYGPEERGPLVAFSLADMHPHDIASVLDEQGIAVRAGNHCAQPLHAHLGLAATVRASFYLYNDRDDVDALVDGLHHVRTVLGA